MREQEWPDEGYPCLDCERAADAHEVYPFLTCPAGRTALRRGYEEGRTDGEHLATQALRADLLQHLQQVVCDVRLGLRHDLADAARRAACRGGAHRGPCWDGALRRAYGQTKPDKS